ncbi:hypothetical protein AAKU55_005183 [Oxalobacteraceae bacterium GrIS 1.11]
MKINTKSVLAAMLFASAGFVAQGAQAAVPTYTASLNLVNDAANFSHDVFVKNTNFIDHFTFTVGAGSDLDAGFRANQGRVDGASISAFNLLDSTGNIVVAGSGLKGNWGIDSTTIAAGSYSLEVIGQVTGSQHGSYAGTLNVSAVPEPETYGMLLMGLGLVGFMARRKAKKVA